MSDGEQIEPADRRQDVFELVSLIVLGLAPALCFSVRHAGSSVEMGFGAAVAVVAAHALVGTFVSQAGDSAEEADLAGHRRAAGGAEESCDDDSVSAREEDGS